MNFSDLLQKLREFLARLPEIPSGVGLHQPTVDAVGLVADALGQLEGAAAADWATLKIALEELEKKVASIRPGASETDVRAMIDEAAEPIWAAVRRLEEAEKADLLAVQNKLENLRADFQKNAANDSERAADLALLQKNLADLETEIKRIAANAVGLPEAEVRVLIAAVVADFERKWAQFRQDLEAEKARIDLAAAAAEAAKLDIDGLRIADQQLAANLKNAVDGLQNALEKLRSDLFLNKTGDDAQGVSLADLVAELAILKKRIDQILGGPDGLPRAEVERLIAEAVAALEAKIAVCRADLETEKAERARLAAVFAAFEIALAELRKADAEAAQKLDATAADLRAALEKMRADFNRSEATETAQRLALASLATLVNALKLDVEALKKAPPSGTTEADVRAWIAETASKIEAEMALLRQKIEENDRDDTARFDDLIQKIEAIKIGNVSIDDVKKLVLKSLETWQKTIALSLASLSKNLGDHQKSLDDLQKRLAALELLIQNLPSGGGFDEAETRAAIAVEIAALRAEIEVKLAAFSTRFLAIETDLGTAQAALRAFEATARGLESRVAQADATAHSANAKAVEADAKASAVAARIDAVLADFGLLKVDFEAKKTQIALLTSRADGFDLKFSGLEASFLLFNSRLETVEKALQNWPPSLDESTVKNWIDAAILDFKIPLGLQIALLERRVDEVEKLPARAAAAEARIDEIFIKIQILDGLAAWKKTIADGLESLGAGHAADQAALVLRIAILEKALLAEPPEKWTDRVRALFLEWKTAFLVEIQQLIDAKETCCAEVAEQAASLAALQKTVAALPQNLIGKAEIERLIAEAEAALRAKIDGLQTRLEEQKTAIDALQTEVDALPEAADLTALLAFFEANLLDFAAWKARTSAALAAQKTEIDDLRADLEALENRVSETAAESPDGTRLARLGLLGWGVAGGLEIRHDRAFRIHLTAGAGVLPDGRLFFEPRNRRFNFYKKWSPPADEAFFQPFSTAKKVEKAKYAATETADGLEIWQLLELEKGSPEAGAEPLVGQNERARDLPFAADKVVLARVGADGKPYYLLMRRADFLEQTRAAAAARVLLGGPTRRAEHSDFVYPEAHSSLDELPDDDQLYRLDPVLRLPEVRLFRFGFRPPTACLPEDLDGSHFPKIESANDLFEAWKPIIDDAVAALSAAIRQAKSQYHALLFEHLTDADAAAYFEKTLGLLASNWSAYKANAAKKPEIKPFCQYFYGWAQDLAAAYGELRAGLQTVAGEIFVGAGLGDRLRFLALGLAVRPHPMLYETPMPELHFQNGLAAPLRDAWRQPPIFGQNGARFEAVRLHYRRVFELIESFYLPDVLPKNRLPKCCCDDAEATTRPDFSRIRITPSRSAGHPLGARAVPFYYPLANSAGSLHWFWDFWRTKTRSVDRILSYHAWAEGQLPDRAEGDLPAPESFTRLQEAIRPLFYALDGVDFFRIEGHIGPAAHDALGQILELRERHGLDFEVRTISIQKPLTMADARGFHRFRNEMLGAEPLAGVPRGGTFVLVLDENGKAVADFALPFRLGKNGEEIA